jgi:hypothetical protein
MKYKRNILGARMNLQGSAVLKVFNKVHYQFNQVQSV